MVNKTYSLINTELHKPIRSTSLSDDKNGIDYRDIHLQEIVREAFPDIFPSIVQIDKQWVYQLLSKNGKDRCSRSSAIDKYNDIPATEVNKLLEGWIILRRKAMEGGISNNLHSILLNFRVPHPEKAIDCYRIEKRNGEERLIVLWGYESDNTPSISLEKALSIMLGVQRNVLVNDRVKANHTGSKNTALIALLCVALVVTGLWGSGVFKKEETSLSQKTTQLGQNNPKPRVSNSTLVTTTHTASTNTLNTPPIVEVVKVDPKKQALDKLQEKRDSRSNLISFFKSEQSVTETKQGLLRCSPDASENIKTVVSNENEDRLKLFNLTSKIDEITVASAIATFATSMGVDITQTEQETVLRIHGSNTVGASLAPKLVTEFLRSRGINNIKIKKEGVESFISYQDGDIENIIEIKAHGSSTAFTETSSSKNVGLMGNYCDLGMASRRIKEKETKLLYDLGLGDMSTPSAEYPIALDGVAIILHPNNPISKLTVQQIADIFSGKIKNWKELGGHDAKITISARDEQSGTWDTFKSRVLKPFQSSLAKARVTRYEDSLLLAKSVATNESCIGFCGLAYVDSSVKGLAVQAANDSTAFEPSRLTVKTQDYALARLLYFYLPSSAPDIAHEFVKFTMSNDGQKVVDNTGLVGQGLSTKADFSNADSYKNKLLKDDNIPRRYKALIKNADRRDTQANLRFASGSMNLDVNSQNNITRLVSFLAERGNENLKINLIGFTDSSGNSTNNQKLSEQRAQAVADMLKTKGVRGVSHFGFGEKMPVANNATTEGQEKNRRVEIWLER